MELVKQAYTPLPMLSVSAEAEDRRNELAQEGLQIKSIATATENDRARNIAVEIRNYLKECEEARVKLTKPLLDGQRELKKLADDHVSPIKTVLDRLERLATAWLQAERDRVAAEEKARLELAAEAKTDSDFEIVMAEPVAGEQKARGQQMRKVLRWEVTDINALVKARPDLCKIEPKASAIQSVCIPEMPNLPPGLKLWWEEKASFTTR